MSADSNAQSGGDGKFNRREAAYRSWVKKGDAEFPAESGRYILYISHACPWANRCNAVRLLKGLDKHIELVVVHATWDRTAKLVSPDLEDEHRGWVFSEGDVTAYDGMGPFHCSGPTNDHINGFKCVREIYYKDPNGDAAKKDPMQTTFSVPVLYDNKKKCIVNNESSEIIRMLNSEFNELPGVKAELNLEKVGCEETDAWIYSGINNGVYKCGFARSQKAYEEAFAELNDALDKVEERLSKQRYIHGNELSLGDIRLFMTLIRYDEVYVVYFKTNKKRLAEYPNITNYMRDVYSYQGVKDSIHMDHIKVHYFTSHRHLNAFAIVPVGGNTIGEMEKPHDRAKF